MSEVHTGGRASVAIRRGSGDSAAPAFAIMALLTAAHGGPADILCSAAHVGSPLSGMTLMYILMSVFHSAPWLKLIASRRAPAREIRAKTSQEIR